jgi:hypothetical protein
VIDGGTIKEKKSRSKEWWEGPESILQLRKSIENDGSDVNGQDDACDRLF